MVIVSNIASCEDPANGTVELLLISAGTWKRTQAGSFNIVVYEDMGSCPGA